MSIVANFITPLIKWIMMVLVILWIIWVIYWVLTRIFKNVGLWLKYRVLGRRYDERVVEWCMKADALDYTVDKVKKILLLEGHLPEKAEEIAYIYTQVRKLKGGLAHDQQKVRDSNLKKLPQV